MTRFTHALPVIVAAVALSSQSNAFSTSYRQSSRAAATHAEGWGLHMNSYLNSLSSPAEQLETDDINKVEVDIIAHNEEPIVTVQENESIEEAAIIDEPVMVEPMMSVEEDMMPTEETIAVEPVMASEEDMEISPTPKELTLEEKITASVASATALGSTQSSYVSASESLRESKTRTQRRLSRSTYEKERAAEKIAKLKAKMEEDARKVEEALQEKLDETQVKIDEEVERIADLLRSEIDLEAKRDTQILQLLSSLMDSISTKENDIRSEETITAEMLEVRSKLKAGTIASQLDDIVAQKQAVTAIERALVEDLKQCTVEVQAVLEDGRSRAARTNEALQRLVRPETKANTPYEWSDIEEMEVVLDTAADNVAASQARIRRISQRVEESLLQKSSVLGEEIPANLISAAKKAAARNVQQKILSVPQINTVNNFKDFKGKDEQELLGLLADSIGKAAMDGSKAALFGMKALLDAATGQSMSDATNEVVEKSSGFTTSLSDISESMKKIQAPKDLANSIVLKEKALSTASVFAAVGKAAATLFNGLGQSESAAKATDALQETSKDLLETFNVAAALGLKLFQATKKQIDVVNAEMAEKDMLTKLNGVNGDKKTTENEL